MEISPAGQAQAQKAQRDPARQLQDQGRPLPGRIAGAEMAEALVHQHPVDTIKRDLDDQAARALLQPVAPIVHHDPVGRACLIEAQLPPGPVIEIGVEAEGPAVRMECAGRVVLRRPARGRARRARPRGARFSIELAADGRCGCAVSRAASLSRLRRLAAASSVAAATISRLRNSASPQPRPAIAK